eukprot:366551-Chlamydomonas_euryale.AAC.38
MVQQTIWSTVTVHHMQMLPSEQIAISSDASLQNIADECLRLQLDGKLTELTEPAVAELWLLSWGLCRDAWRHVAEMREGVVKAPSQDTGMLCRRRETRLRHGQK